MKKLAFIVMAVTAMLTLGCSSDDGGSGSNDEMYIKWTVNGVSYTIEDPQTGSSLATAIQGYQGINEDFRSMTLTMPNNATVGTHPLEYDNGSQTGIYSASYAEGEDSWGAISGTLVIQSIQGEYIQGTFSFTGQNSDDETYTISNGSFRAYKPMEPGN